MRRARLRTTVNLAAAQNRRRQIENPDIQNNTKNSPDVHNATNSDLEGQENSETRPKTELPKASESPEASSLGHNIIKSSPTNATTVDEKSNEEVGYT